MFTKIHFEFVNWNSRVQSWIMDLGCIWKRKKDNIRRAVVPAFPTLSPPKSYEFIFHWATFVWVFVREQGEGLEWLSCHVHLNILTFCTEKKVQKKLYSQEFLFQSFIWILSPQKELNFSYFHAHHLFEQYFHFSDWRVCSSFDKVLLILKFCL